MSLPTPEPFEEWGAAQERGAGGGQGCEAHTPCEGQRRRGKPSACAPGEGPSPGGDHVVQVGGRPAATYGLAWPPERVAGSAASSRPAPLSGSGSTVPGSWECRVPGLQSRMLWGGSSNLCFHKACGVGWGKAGSLLFCSSTTGSIKSTFIFGRNSRALQP